MHKTFIEGVQVQLWFSGDVIQGIAQATNLSQKEKGYIHRPESVVENETLQILWDFETQTDYSILVRKALPSWLGL